MIQIALIGVGAGLAAALLFSAPIGGTFLALPLFAITALPVAIAGLGWTPLAGAVAALAGSAAIFTVLSPLAAAFFLLLFILPILWLVYLAGLSRTNDDGQEWFPLGRLLMHAAASVAIGLTATAVVLGYDPEVVATEMIEAVSQWLSDHPELETQPNQEDLEAFVRLNVSALPYALSSMGLIVLVINLWLAAIVTRASGRFARPPERLWTVSLPRSASGVFAAAVVVSLLPFPLGEIGALVAGAFGCALALLGLAVLHALTFGNNARAILLTLVYILLILFGFPVIILIALGIAEAFLQLRARRFAGAPPPT